jgi:signal transduction histidine kinase
MSDAATQAPEDSSSQVELQEFIAGLSHQLKTPLTAIIGLTETLLKKELAPSTQSRFLAKIGDQARRLSSVLDDLLTLSALQSESGISFESVDLRVPLAASAQDLVPLAEDKGLEMAVDLPTEPITILGDYGALRTLIGNLLDNAIKYTNYGGKINLRLSILDQQAEISIEDTGIGIDPADQKRIFDRFFRGHAARQSGVRSTGLGLAIASQIALAHRGDIAVDSMPGRGSKFTVHLPRANL